MRGSVKHFLVNVLLLIFCVSLITFYFRGAEGWRYFGIVGFLMLGFFWDSDRIGGLKI